MFTGVEFSIPFPPDPYKMHCGDGLDDLLFFPSGAHNASALTRQSDPLRDSHGTSSRWAGCSLQTLPWSLPITFDVHLAQRCLGAGQALSRPIAGENSVGLSGLLTSRDGILNSMSYGQILPPHFSASFNGLGQVLFICNFSFFYLIRGQQ